MNGYAKIREAILSLAEQRERVTVAIDGPCASGKTTLGERLARELDATLVHADDFFLPPEKRTEERKKEVGGNIDYERLRSEVIDSLSSDAPFTYRKFDCHSRSFSEVRVTPKKIRIVEGSYSCHPYFGRPYDLTVFVTVQESEQKRRIQKRNPAMARTFFEVWIPKENAYFEAFGVKESADIVI